MNIYLTLSYEFLEKIRWIVMMCVQTLRKELTDNNNHNGLIHLTFK